MLSHGQILQFCLFLGYMEVIGDIQLYYNSVCSLVLCWAIGKVLQFCLYFGSVLSHRQSITILSVIWFYVEPWAKYYNSVWSLVLYWAMHKVLQFCMLLGSVSSHGWSALWLYTKQWQSITLLSALWFYTKPWTKYYNFVCYLVLCLAMDKVL